MTNQPTKTIRRQIQLPFATSVRMAWQSIRVRSGRSILVMSGIVLSLAFLSHILSSEALRRHVSRVAPAQAPQELEEHGVPRSSEQLEARTRTRWIVGLALMIAFVGVLNAMLLSVTERFREIGTMKCLGALDSLIIRLFLLESLFQGLVGTLLGILIGLGLTVAQGWVVHGLEVWRMLPLVALLRIGGRCLLLGIALTVCGALYPAWWAARMQPVAALRSEL
jgi:predicted lysophospholipase L1 biosynthesis ABC-type transport system permease subunit